MNVYVGSKNPVKVNAVREVIADYPMLRECDVFGIDADSGVSEQPRNLDETLMGAMNRAKRAFMRESYSFGIESGLMVVPYTKTGKMDLTACAIYDGQEFHLGLSSAFEFPIEVTRMIHENGIDANEAFFRCGLTADRKVGSSEGGIGLLTKGRVTRSDYTKQAIRMALIHLENRELY